MVLAVGLGGFCSRCNKGSAAQRLRSAFRHSTSLHREPAVLRDGGGRRGGLVRHPRNLVRRQSGQSGRVTGLPTVGRPPETHVGLPTRAAVPLVNGQRPAGLSRQGGGKGLHPPPRPAVTCLSVCLEKAVRWEMGLTPHHMPQGNPGPIEYARRWPRNKAAAQCGLGNGGESWGFQQGGP